MRRIVLAFALAASAGPAFAVQDRYGPPQSTAPLGARVAPASVGPMLDWQGKTTAPQGAFEPTATRRPEPIAPWAQRLTSVQPQAAIQPPVAAAPPPPPLQQQARMAPPPAPPQQARPLPAPANAPRPYAARPAQAPAPVATAQAPGASDRPRVYSVGRQYGAQPDPIFVAPAQRGQALTLNELPASENLGRTQAPLDDGRASQAVMVPDTKQNAASNRISRLGL